MIEASCLLCHETNILFRNRGNDIQETNILYLSKYIIFNIHFLDKLRLLIHDDDVDLGADC